MGTADLFNGAAGAVARARRYYFAPTRPFDLADAVNRAAAAAGTSLRVGRTSTADHDGHHVSVARVGIGGLRAVDGELGLRGWRASYTRGVVHYLVRDVTFTEAFDGALLEHARGALGGTVYVECADDAHRLACEASGLLPWTKEAEEGALASWYTPLHAAAAGAVRLEQAERVPATDALLRSRSIREYEAEVEALRWARAEARW